MFDYLFDYTAATYDMIVTDRFNEMNTSCVYVHPMTVLLQHIITAVECNVVNPKSVSVIDYCGSYSSLYTIKIFYFDRVSGNNLVLKY